MTVLLILLILLFILIILNLFVSVPYEGFQTSIPLNPDTIQGYNNFLSFYNPFCANWQKAIISSIAADTPQEPLTSPSQVGSSTPSTPSDSDMNTYITQLSQQLGQPLPPVCVSLPTTVDSTNIAQIIPMIPTDTTPYINALTWMNTQMEKSQANLGSALQGGSPTEGFDDLRSSSGASASSGQADMCQDISQCLANNPQLAQQIAEELNAQSAQQVVQQEQQLMTLLIPFVSTQALSEAFGQNVILVEKAQEIQNQAQSGALVNQINVPGGNSKATYSMPDGSDNLKQIQQNDPNRYNELKKNYGMWVAIKGLTDQINATL
jgi:hypothetical protein